MKFLNVKARLYAFWYMKLLASNSENSAEKNKFLQNVKLVKKREREVKNCFCLV